MIANFGIAVAKFVAFLVTGAASMLAEAIHSVADTSNQGLLLYGGKRARQSPTSRHQFGFGRERYFWSFVVALVLFSVGGLFAAYEGIEKIRHPHEVESLGWAIGVLVFGIFLEGFSFRTAIVESNNVRGDSSWREFVRHARSPELPVVLLEDAGAMIGLVLALGGVSIAAITGDPVWDGIGTLCIGVLLIVIAMVLAYEMKSLLIGEAATRKDHEAITAVLRATQGVVDIVELRTQHIGPDELLVAGRLALQGGLTFGEISATLDEAAQRIDEAVPARVVMYLEPQGS